MLIDDKDLGCYPQGEVQETGNAGVNDEDRHCGVIFVAMPRFYTMVHFRDRKTNKKETNKSEEIISVPQGLIKTTLGQVETLTLG